MSAKVVITLTAILLFPLTLPAAWEPVGRQQAKPPQKYLIRPPSRAGTAISVLARSTRQIQVQVTDENDKPVPDLPMLFSLASSSFGTFAFNRTSQPRLRTVGYTAEDFPPADVLPVQVSIRRVLTNAQGKASVRFIAASMLGEVALKISIEGTDIAWEGTILVIDKPNEKEEKEEAPTGVLNGKGHIEINGNTVPTPTGLTIFNGNTIETGSDSHAEVEWPNGRIVLEEKTKVTITVTEEKLTIDYLECGDLTVETGPGLACSLKLVHHPHSHVAVKQGMVQLKSKDPKKQLQTGEEEKIKDLEEISCAGGTIYHIWCGHRRIWPFFLPTPALIIPFVTHDDDNNPAPVLSPLTP